MFKTGKYDVEILNNRDGVAGDYELFYSDGKDCFNFSSYLIKVYKDNTLLKSACVSATAGATGLHKHSFIIEESRVVICCANVVFCLTIPGLELIWQKEVEWATCFQIFPYQDDYIVHGELTITRLNHYGEIVWQQSGADIFVTIDGKENFLITGEHIEVKDWDLKNYRFDFDGNILSD